MGCCLCGFLFLLRFFIPCICFSLQTKIQKHRKKIESLEAPSSPPFDSVICISPTAWDSCQRDLGPKFEVHTSRRRLSFLLFRPFSDFGGLDHLFLYLHFFRNDFRKPPSFLTFDWASHICKHRGLQFRTHTGTEWRFT